MRILHISDVHLPFPEGSRRDAGMLHPKRMLAMLNYKLRRMKKYAEGETKLAGLEAWLEQEPVDWILYTGDSVNQGLEGEYLAAAPRMARTLGMARGGALAVPGNHDWYTEGSVRRYRRRMGARLPKSDRPEWAGREGFPLVRFMGEEAVAIGLNTAVPHFNFWDSSGLLRAEEAERTAEILDRPEVRDRRWVFVMTHYPYLDTDWLHGLRGTEALWKVLAGRRNVVLLHGHNHYAYEKRGPEGQPVFCAGSLTKDGAESFWLFEPYGDYLNARLGRWGGGRWWVGSEK